MPEEVAGNMVGVPAPAQSFKERKAAQLRQERAVTAEPSGAPSDEAPETRPPSEPDGISEDVEQSQGLYADEENDQEDLEEDAALDDEQPADTDPGDPEEDTVDWKKRHDDLRRETQRLMESRSEMDREHADSMAKHLELRYQLEDTLTEAVARAEYMRNTMAGNAQQYQNINWAQVQPDKVQEVQAQAQQAYAMAQQADQVWQQLSQESQAKREQVKQREAESAKTRLRRTIPNWSGEVYSELRDFASEVGMPAQEFNEITNPVIIEALHAYQHLRKGASGVKKPNVTRKAQKPRGKAARQLPRDERGQFARKKVEPNTRGSFTDRHKHRLAAERQGR